MSAQNIEVLRVATAERSAEATRLDPRSKDLGSLALRMLPCDPSAVGEWASSFEQAIHDNPQAFGNAGLDVEELIAFHQQRNVATFVVEDNAGTIVAGVTAHVNPHNCLVISNLFRSSAYRERRIGSAMLGWILKRACEAGISYATLEVMRDNHHARDLYTGVGFEKYKSPLETEQSEWMRLPSRRAIKDASDQLLARTFLAPHTAL